MKNNRRNFIRLTGLAGATSLVPFDKILAGAGSKATESCVLIPSETAGPFPLDVTSNTFYFRQDVRESKAGVQLNLKMKIIGVNNCQPMENVRVNIWHCDKDGSYSGYSTSVGNTTNTVGETWLRGYQIADANGEVEFITIFPGWYNGRVCHIHFQVYVNSSYAAISQLTFEVNAKNAIYAANPSLYTKGTDPLSPGNDGVFSDGYTYQLAPLTPNSTTGGYDSYLEVAVQGSGSPVGISNLEKETAKQFTLGQNFPNPYKGETTIPFTLQQAGDVKLELWDLMGRRAASIVQNGMSAGDHAITVNMNSLGLATGNYVYQLEVVNSSGTYRSCKMMTAQR